MLHRMNAQHILTVKTAISTLGKSTALRSWTLFRVANVRYGLSNYFMYVYAVAILSTRLLID